MGNFPRLVPQSRKEVAKWRRAPTSSAAANAARPGATTPQLLRRLFLAARNHLRLRFAPLAPFARTVRLACAEHVALSRTAAVAGRISGVAPSGIHAARERSAARRRDRIAPALRQE